MHEGIVLRVIGGFFRVMLSDGRIVETKPRGRLRKEGISIVAGDRVHVKLVSDEQGVIEGVEPRTTELQRPSVANVDQVVCVMAVADPPPSHLLLDRLLVMARFAGLSTLIVWNKCDLLPADDVEREVAVYARAGYDVIATSGRTGVGIDALQIALQDRVSTLAGPSGVGKSALLNRLNPLWERATGEVSDRLGRGRHTTRAVELLPLSQGGLVADTPGFSTLDIRDIPKDELAGLWPDLARLSGECRYPGCMHVSEPDCAVMSAVEEGDIHRRRYDNYIVMHKELEQWEARKYS